MRRESEGVGGVGGQGGLSPNKQPPTHPVLLVKKSSPPPLFQFASDATLWLLGNKFWIATCIANPRNQNKILQSLSCRAQLCGLLPDVLLKQHQHLLYVLCGRMLWILTRQKVLQQDQVRRLFYIKLFLRSINFLEFLKS